MAALPYVAIDSAAALHGYSLVVLHAAGAYTPVAPGEAVHGAPRHHTVRVAEACVLSWRRRRRRWRQRLVRVAPA